MRLRPACQATIRARLPQPTSGWRNDLVNADGPVHGGLGHVGAIRLRLGKADLVLPTLTAPVLAGAWGCL